LTFLTSAEISIIIDITWKLLVTDIVSLSFRAMAIKLLTNKAMNIPKIKIEINPKKGVEE
jgi:hypothetical protein